MFVFLYVTFLYGSYYSTIVCVSICVYMYVCMYVCMYVRVCVNIFLCTQSRKEFFNLRRTIHIYNKGYLLLPLHGLLFPTNSASFHTHASTYHGLLVI